MPKSRFADNPLAAIFRDAHQRRGHGRDHLARSPSPSSSPMHHPPRRLEVLGNIMFGVAMAVSFQLCGHGGGGPGPHGAQLRPTRA